MAYSMVNFLFTLHSARPQLSCVASEMNVRVLKAAHHYALCQPDEVNPRH